LKTTIKCASLYCHPFSRFEILNFPALQINPPQQLATTNKNCNIPSDITLMNKCKYLNYSKSIEGFKNDIKAE